MSLTVALTDLMGVPGPASRIAYALVPYLDAMQTIVFHDNEYGDVAGADVKLERAVRVPVARWLDRQRSNIGMLRIVVNHKRRHSLDISFKLRVDGGWSPEEKLTVAVFTPSDRARAKEKAEIESGEAGERQGPRRGAKGGGNGRRKRRKIEATSK